MGTDTENRAGLRVACYCRVSTGKQAEHGHSLGAQRDRLEAWAQRHGAEIVAVVEDGGESGTSLDRPGWREVCELVAAGRVDAVVSCKGDRVARSLRDLLNLIAELEAAGVRLVLADEDLDSSSPAGELTFQLRAAVSQYEVALAKQRTRETMAAAKARGVVFGRPPLGYSRRGGKLVPNDRYPVVELAHRLRRRGLRLADIADELNRRGVVTGSGRGSWHPGNVARLLKSPLQEPVSVVA